MGEPAQKRDERTAAETRDERIDRLLAAVEQLVQDNRRERTRKEDAARRAARQAGPTTAELEAMVRARHQKIRSKM